MCLAVPGRVVRLGTVSGSPVADVEFGDTVRQVNLSLVPEASVGDYVIVHSGIAIRTLSPDQAAEVLEGMSELPSP